MKKKIINITEQFFLIWILIGVGLSIPLSGAAFEHRDFGARATGLSGAFTAIADDTTGIYHNPAGLPQIKEDQIEVMYNNLYSLSIVNYYFIGYVRPIMNEGAVSLAWIHMGLGEDFKVKNFSEETILLGYGFNLIDNLNLGATLKYYAASYNRTRGAAWGADISSLYSINQILFLGIHVQDVNFPVIKWENQVDDKMKLNLNAGIGLKVTKLFTLSTDVKNILIYKRVYCVGAELEIFEKTLYLRSGLSFQKIFNFSVGAGYYISNFQFHYSAQKHSDLGWNNVIGLTVKI